jgi:hypothetical protein
VGDQGRPGTGSRPGIESQTSARLSKASEVPGPGSPNEDAYDVSPEAEALRPGVDDRAGDPRAGAGDLDETPADADDGTEGA